MRVNNDFLLVKDTSKVRGPGKNESVHNINVFKRVNVPLERGSWGAGSLRKAPRWAVVGGPWERKKRRLADKNDGSQRKTLAGKKKRRLVSSALGFPFKNGFSLKKNHVLHGVAKRRAVRAVVF